MRYIKFTSSGKSEGIIKFFQDKDIAIQPDGLNWLVYRAESGSKGIQCFVEALSAYLWSHEMELLVKQYLRKKKFFSEAEVSSICERTMEIAYGLKEGSDVILSGLSDYLQDAAVLSVPGFVTFRLQGLRADLEALADLCSEEWIAQREYDAFIQMLKSFVEVQEPYVDEVHFITDDKGKHHLYSNEGVDVSLKCLDDFVDDSMVNEANYDDLMVSSLISMAPRRIFLHNEKLSRNPQLVETVKGIFAGRVIVWP